MKRILLATVFLAAGIPLLLWMSGGAGGPGAQQADPEVKTETVESIESPGLERPMGLPVSVDVVEGYSQASRPESLTFVDQESGERVVVPVFERWHFTAQSGRPVEARRSGRQAVALEDLELLMFREPRTLAEAHAVERGERILKWRVTAPAARVDDLALQSLDEQPGGPETVVQLSGGVRIYDLDNGVEIQGESLEVQPYLEKARGTGDFVVQHEAFELEGNGLELERQENRSTVVIHENAVADLYGDLPAADGEPLLDLGSGEFRPGTLNAEGGAVLVHRVGRDGVREDLSLEMTHVVHAEQEGGRSLDADLIRLKAFRTLEGPLTADSGPQEMSRWQVERFDAEGDVIVLYPGTTDEGASYVLSASAHRMVYEVTPGTNATVLLEGDVEIILRGDVPLEGLGATNGPSVMRATAREQAVLAPAPIAEIRPGHDPMAYRLVTLRGDAKLAFRGSGLEPTEDTLAGEQMRLLLRERDDVEMAALQERRGEAGVGRIAAVSFAVLGDVRLGGTRMSGMTHRFVATGLDTDGPVFEASGPGTSFAFHGLRRGERMLGGDDATAGSDDAPLDPEEEPVWVIQRLLARGSVVVDTTLGGPSVGMPTRLDGEELSYDRVSDRARLVGSGAAPAALAVGAEAGKRQRLSARSLQLDRGLGIVEARGHVRGVLLAHSGSESDTGSGFALPERRLGAPASFGVATNGRIEIRTQVGTAPWDPRVDTEQIIRIEGDLVAQMTADTLETDRLRARTLEIALVHTNALERPPASPSAPSARMGGPTPTGRRPSASPAGASGRLVPWTIETESMRARFTEEGMSRLEASGGIRFWSEEGEIGGDSFEYEAATREARLRGRAHATFGPQDGRSEVRADELVMQVGADGPEQLRAIGRTLAVLIRRNEKEPHVVERFFVWCRGVTMTPTEFRTDDLEQVLQQQRSGPAGPWESPFSLWADRVVVTGRDLLSQRTADVQRLVASGPKTTLRTGEGPTQTTVWGDRFELDVPTSRATLDAGPSGDLKIQLGTRDDERMRLDQTHLVVDVETGKILDWDHSKVVIRGAHK